MAKKEASNGFTFNQSIAIVIVSVALLLGLSVGVDSLIGNPLAWSLPEAVAALFTLIILASVFLFFRTLNNTIDSQPKD